LIKPYYQDEWTTIYLGDCREVLPNLGKADDIYMTITDPPWPGCNTELTKQMRYTPELIKETLVEVSRISERLAVILGCDSDPRLLSDVPLSLPFFVACWMSRNPPTPKGYKWYSGEVAYVYGSGFRNDKRSTLMSSELKYVSIGHRTSNHPCPRNDLAMKRFIGTYTKSNDIILDPFMGSGTTIIASKHLGRRSIGIEINEAYCIDAIERMKQSVMVLS